MKDVHVSFSCVCLLRYVYNIVFNNQCQHIHYVVLHFIIIIQVKTNPGIFDFFFFYGRSNVQNYGSILSAKYPSIKVDPSDEYVVSLIFSDIFQKSHAYNMLVKFSNRLINIFGSIRHGTTAMFNS